MLQIARTVVAYHGCAASFARNLLLGGAEAIASMTSTDSLVAAAHQLMDRFSKKSAAERFTYWVRLGMVNREGRLTKAYGGDVDAEANSIEAAAAVLDDLMEAFVLASREGQGRRRGDPSHRQRSGEGERAGKAPLPRAAA
jgi:hypothetical protein